jgi:hypothetical protein
MKKVVSCLALLALLSIPFLSACGTDKLAKISQKKQMNPSAEAQLVAGQGGYGQGSELSAKVDVLAKVNRA